MKKNSHAHDNRLNRILRAAYFEKINHPVGSQWQRDAMQKIRLWDRLADNPLSDGVLLEHQFWRLAPVAALLIMLMGVGLAVMEIVPEYDLYQAFGYELSLSSFLEIFTI